MTVKDQIRSIFKLPLFEKLMVEYCTDKIYGRGLTKLVPNHYSYKDPTIRNALRNSVRYELNISNIVDWSIYFGFEEVAKERLFQIPSNPKTIIDVGANIGEISFRFATQFPQATIYSFEPHPKTFNNFIANYNLNTLTNIQAINSGLGSKKGEVYFEERQIGNPGMNRVTSDHEKSTHQIQITTLDTFFQENNLSDVSLIKIDVEGYELEVLKGATHVIETYKPPLFIELDDSNLMEQGANATDFVQFIESFGYVIEHAETTEVITKNSNLKNSHFDIICKPLV